MKCSVIVLYVIEDHADISYTINILHLLWFYLIHHYAHDLYAKVGKYVDSVECHDNAAQHNIIFHTALY